MRPLWYDFPTASGVNKIETQFMLGDSLLVAPVLQKDQTRHD